MTVTLYNCTSDPNVLNKNYTVVQSNISATAKGAVDVDRPVLLLNYSSMDFNYFYVAEFNRFYNVFSRSLIPGQHIVITGESDPIESFRSSIADLDVLAVRCEDSANRSAEIADNNIPIESDLQYDKVIGDTVITNSAGMIVIGVV